MVRFRGSRVGTLQFIVPTFNTNGLWDMYGGMVGGDKQIGKGGEGRRGVVEVQ